MEQLKEHWWKVLVAGLVVVGLVWWRQGTGQQTEELVDEDVQLEERVNRFLEESNIQIPEGAERANLEDVAGGEGTGIATRAEGVETTNFNIIAGLPELETGSYQGWLVRGEGDYVRLGRLNMAKGGHVLETSLSGDYSDVERVVVSEESEVGAAPSEVVLEGRFADAIADEASE